MPTFKEIEQTNAEKRGTFIPYSKEPFSLAFCVKCQKPVEKMEVWENLESVTTKLKVLCHGETETVTFYAEDLGLKTRYHRELGQGGDPNRYFMGKSK